MSGEFLKFLFLWLLSRVYATVVFFRNFLFDAGRLKSVKLPGRVISVGNLAVGGTGKSPVVIAFARKIAESGGNPAILTRGYKSGLRGDEWQVLVNGVVVAGTNRDDIRADEARMQSLSLKDIPVIVGANRAEAAHNYVRSIGARSVTHWILDDGFQHRKIIRDLDVVVMDARSPSGPLLPAGLFREPLHSLRRANMVILTKAEGEAQVSAVSTLVKSIVPSMPVFVAGMDAGVPRKVIGRNSETPDRWAAVVGIAKPADFIEALRALNITPARTFIYADHESFNPYEVQSFRAEFDAVITTEKDWARDESRYLSLGVPVYVLPLALRWVGAEPGILI